MIASDNVASSPYVNNLYCAWTTFNTPETVNFNRSIDGGNTFSSSINLKNGPGQGANVQTGPNGEVYVCYADYGANNSFPANGFGFVKSLNGGATFTPAQVAVSYTGIRKSNTGNPLFNNIRVNDFPSMAVDKSGGPNNGRIYVVFAAQQNGNGKAVIELCSSGDKGSSWSVPQVVSISNGFESFFPWITVDQTTGAIYIAYFSIDGSGFQTNTYLAVSNDGGNSIVNQRVSDLPHITQPIVVIINGKNVFSSGYEGDYIGVAAQNGKAYVAWMDERTGTWKAYVSEVDNVQTPIITGPVTAFCTSATFTATNVPTGQTVTWSASPTGIVSLTPSGNTVTVSKISQGFVTLSATLNSGVTGTLNITTVPSVTAISATMSGSCSNGYQTWYLSATPNMAATNWQWTVDNPSSGFYNIFSPNSQSTYVSVSGGGGVSVTYKDPCGETSYRNGVTIYSPCGRAGSIVAFPNPANNQLTIQQSPNQTTASIVTADNTASLQTVNNFSVKLYNAQGQILKTGQTTQANPGVVLNTRDISSGTYFLHVKLGTDLIEQQIIIQH